MNSGSMNSGSTTRDRQFPRHSRNLSPVGRPPERYDGALAPCETDRVPGPRVTLGPILLICVAATLFGTVGTALSKAPDGTPSLSAATLRLLVGGLALAVLARGWNLSGRWRVCLVGAAGVAVYQSMFFAATTSTGVAMASLVTIGASPLASRLIALVRRRPAPPRLWWLAATVLGVGVTVLVIGGYDDLTVEPRGLVAAVIAGVAYAAYTEAGAVLIADGVRTTTAMAALFLGGGLLLSPTLPFLDNSWVAEGRGAVVLAYIGFVTLTLAYVAFGRGLAHLEPSTVVTLTILEPVVAAIASTLLLDQTLRPLGWFGAALVLAGLPLVALAGSDRTAGHD